MALDFPNTPVDGQVYDNYYYDASMQSWRAYGTVNLAVPAGIINQYGGSTAPSGYLMCLGQSISITEYPALFQAIGYTYGGSGVSFNVPNLQNRAPVGLGTEIEFNALGKTGGNKIHQLSVNEMPIHSHEQDPHNHDQNPHNHDQNSHVHDIRGGYVAPTSQSGFTNTPTASGGAYGFTYSSTEDTQPTTATNIAATATNKPATATNQNTGGLNGVTQPHNNLQPYIVLNYIIKT
jgi:microcystin-dependent protein